MPRAPGTQALRRVTVQFADRAGHTGSARRRIPNSFLWLPVGCVVHDPFADL
jgi:hypothetical protein